MPTKHETVEELLDRHGETFSQELGITLEDGTPSALFQWLCASVLYSARTNSELATRSAKELQHAGWRTAEAMADSSWDDRTKALTEGGYTRYRERTATMLGDSPSTCSSAGTATSGSCLTRRSMTPATNAGCSRRSRGSATSGSTSSCERCRSPGRSSRRSPTRGR